METDNKTCHKFPKHRHGGKKGPSSFWMHDPDKLFNELNLQKGETFCDLGCGIGDYALEASKYIGEEGNVFAIDINGNAIDFLNETIASQNIKNIHTAVADVTYLLPLNDSSIDRCFIATALHAMDLNIAGRSLFSAIRRVLKPNGRLEIIECHKKRTNFGPPESCRVSPEELEEIITPYGFSKEKVVDLGHNYLIRFCVNNED